MPEVRILHSCGHSDKEYKQPHQIHNGKLVQYSKEKCIFCSRVDIERRELARIDNEVPWDSPVWPRVKAL